MDNLKEAFNRVKNDYEFLLSEINHLKSDLDLLKSNLIDLCNIISNLNSSLKSSSSQELDLSLKSLSLDRFSFPTQDLLIPTHRQQISTDITPFKPLKDKISSVSIGNEGVPTDRQTDQQTHQQTDNSSYNPENSLSPSQIINSLDSLKKDLRVKFKRLTDQEFLVFSTIYQLEEERGFTDYKSLSEKLNLTESSIRDYVGRLVKKGISIEKTKINNKSVQISLSSELKKIATLDTILKIRNL